LCPAFFDGFLGVARIVVNTAFADFHATEPAGIITEDKFDINFSEIALGDFEAYLMSHIQFFGRTLVML
jgi:hypothetical protein